MSSTLENQWNDQFSLAKDLIGDIEDEFNKIDAATSTIIETVSSAVKEGVQELGKVKDKLVSMYNEAEPHHFPVISLIHQSFAWLDSVKNPISNLSPQVKMWRDQNLSSWTGEGASQAYRIDKTTEQKNAIDDVWNNAEKISEWLMDIAQRNVDYMLKFVDYLGKIAGQFTSLAVSAASIGGIAEAFGDGAEIVGGLVEKMMDELTDVASRFMAAVSDERKIDSITSDNSALPGGKWPQSVVG